MLIFKCDKLILHHEYNLITFKADVFSHTYHPVSLHIGKFTITKGKSASNRSHYFFLNRLFRNGFLGFNSYGG